MVDDGDGEDDAGFDDFQDFLRTELTQNVRSAVSEELAALAAQDEAANAPSELEYFDPLDLDAGQQLAEYLNAGDAALTERVFSTVYQPIIEQAQQQQEEQDKALWDEGVKQVYALLDEWKDEIGDVDKDVVFARARDLYRSFEAAYGPGGEYAEDVLRLAAQQLAVPRPTGAPQAARADAPYERDSVPDELAIASHWQPKETRESLERRGQHRAEQWRDAKGRFVSAGVVDGDESAVARAWNS